MPLGSPLPPEYRPRLRPGLAAAPLPSSTDIVVHDTHRLSPSVVRLTRRQLEWANLFTGTRSLRDIQMDVSANAGGALVTTDEIAKVVTLLDEALLLDSPTFRDYLTGPVRLPSCLGTYPTEPAGIASTLDALFTAPGGPGRPNRSVDRTPRGRLRAVLAPHMDYGRGGVTYGWAFKELIEQTDAKLFVIVATSHYSPHRFTLSRMSFATPLGLAETDQSYVDRLANEYGDEVFDDPFAHLPEHSIELEVLLLQYLLGEGNFRILPLLVGSFGDCVQHGHDPHEAEDIARMVAALRKVESAAGEPICYLISGDLAHIGPKFRDPKPVDDPWLAASRAQDDKILTQLSAADPTGYFEVIAAEKDQRRICGLPPTWLTLEVARPRAGRVLHYDRYVHPTGHESVSFAAAAFYE